MRLWQALRISGRESVGRPDFRLICLACRGSIAVLSVEDVDVNGLKKRSVSLAGHATSVALEPEFWAIIDLIASERELSQAGMLSWIDKGRGRRPLASACRLLALDWALGRYRPPT